jgi:hypothetical protein
MVAGDVAGHTKGAIVAGVNRIDGVYSKLSRCAILLVSRLSSSLAGNVCRSSRLKRATRKATVVAHKTEAANHVKLMGDACDEMNPVVR